MTYKRVVITGVSDVPFIKPRYYAPKASSYQLLLRLAVTFEKLPPSLIFNLVCLLATDVLGSVEKRRDSNAEVIIPKL